jgi:hypothetical protein
VQHFIVEIAEIKTPAATGAALFALAVFLDDDRDRAAHQRPDVGGQPAIGTGDQNHLVFAGQRSHDLRDTRIEGAGKPSRRSSSLTLASAGSEAIGSCGTYSAWPARRV